MCGSRNKHDDKADKKTEHASKCKKNRVDEIKVDSSKFKLMCK